MADPSSRRRLEPLALLASTTLTALLLGGGCHRPSNDDEIASPEVPTITAETGRVTRRDLVERLVVRGTIAAVPNRDVRIAAQVPGRLVAMDAAEGDTVRAGQVLARLEARPFEDQRRQAVAALSQARAALENAELNLTRTQRLFERGIAAAKEAEDARTQRASAAAAVEQARAALDTAERQLARSRVASPIAGQVVKRFVSVGEQVDGTAAQPLVEVANLARVELAAHLAAGHLSRVRAGQPALVVSDAYAGRTFPGEVIAIAPAVDQATNAALVRIGVDNQERLLKVGLSAEARIAVDQKRGALTVPPAAVTRDDSGQAAVYVVSGDLAARTGVTLGLETGEAVEVLSGVAEGQTVLVSAVHGLGEKARLAPRP